jgi:hypothetical protein
MSSVFDRLASVLGRKDQAPNQELARELATDRNEHAIKELLENLFHETKAIQNDCIKVLYEVGALEPD